MRRTLLCTTAWLVAAAFAARADQTASVKMADAFGLPVGLDNGKRYYKARGYRPNGHLGEDWNGVGGGDTDLGDPVYVTANGLVVYAQDFRAGWGNVVIVRHAYLERGDTRFVDSLYGHLDRILVREGQRLERGDKVGTIGTAHGHYPAHLHFEMRKDIRVGMYRSMFPRDFRTYFDPTQFVMSHQSLSGDNRTAQVPINTFPNQSGFAEAGTLVAKNRTATEQDKPTPVTSSGKRIVYTNGVRWASETGQVTTETRSRTPVRKGLYRIDRYEDIRRGGR